MVADIDNSASEHLPVLLDEVIAALQPSPGMTFVDATIGRGGHARSIAARLGPTGRLIGIDRDPSALAAVRENAWDCPVELVLGNFADLELILRRLKRPPVDGVLADLGVSSPQLNDPERGFSFRQAGPLDMRMDPSIGEPASNLVNRLDVSELTRIFREFGEERHARRIAERVVDRRRRKPIETTVDLAELIRSIVPRARGKGTSIDPATRVFQALRIAVNDELASLETFLDRLPWCLAPGGRAALISFHSLEDRRVKHAFQDRRYWSPVTKKPVLPTEDETRVNPRSRSAKLRVAIRMEEKGQR